MARREDWGEALPASVAVLTAGVDVQGDRIEVQILGWGRDEEAWVIEYRVLWGDPSGPRLWSDLDMVLQATFPHPAGDRPARARGGHRYRRPPYQDGLRVLPHPPRPPYLGDQGAAAGPASRSGRVARPARTRARSRSSSSAWTR
jgi:hypothetical protein